MSTMVVELYDALRKAGLEDDVARAAAKAVMGIEDRVALATKADLAELRVDMARLKAEVIMWNVGSLVALAGITATIVTLVR